MSDVEKLQTFHAGQDTPSGGKWTKRRKRVGDANDGTDEPLALETVKAIHTGDIDALRRLGEHPDLATARLGRPACGMSRILRHITTDWPGNFPKGAATVAALISNGADVNARFTGQHTETPLHWAASSDDVSVLDALFDHGADIEAPGAVIAGRARIEPEQMLRTARSHARLCQS